MFTGSGNYMRTRRVQDRAWAIDLIVIKHSGTVWAAAAVLVDGILKARLALIDHEAGYLHF